MAALIRENHIAYHFSLTHRPPLVNRHGNIARAAPSQRYLTRPKVTRVRKNVPSGTYGPLDWGVASDKWNSVGGRQCSSLKNVGSRHTAPQPSNDGSPAPGVWRTSSDSPPRWMPRRQNSLRPVERVGGRCGPYAYCFVAALARAPFGRPRRLRRESRAARLGWWRFSCPPTYTRQIHGPFQYWRWIQVQSQWSASYCQRYDCQPGTRTAHMSAPV